MEKKLKMSGRTFRRIWIPILAVIVIIAMGLNIAANIFADSLDTYLGRGERKVAENAGLTAEDAAYYEQKYADTNAENGSVANGLKVSKRITDEGEVLMKNDGTLPLSEGADVTVFGYRYLSPVYGGTGSGNVDASKDYVTTAEEAMAKYFNVNSATVDAMNGAAPQELTSDGISNAQADESGKGFSGATTSIFEYDPSIYAGTEESCEGTTGVVFIGRTGGEGGNLQQTAYADGTPHELALSEYEKDTIRFAKENCENVIAVINSSNVMELGELMSGDLEVNGIIWIGGPGATGLDSLADIMAGVVNPSGRTADIWDADLTKNPTYVNFGEDRTYTNTADIDIATNYKGLYFVEYEEGVYYGYRYYETGSDLGYLDYGDSVVFPFGYGLSYTTFEQRLTSVEQSDGQITFTVEVENTGDVDGKETVQLYYNPPYTDLDTEYKIEKPTKNLLAFDKVGVKAGETETVTLTVNEEDMASYSYMHDNGDGTQGCWMLEEGDYGVILGKNSHEAWAEDTVNIPETIWYTSDNPRQSEIDAQSAMDEEGNLLDYPAKAETDPDAEYIAATNQFSEVTEYMNEETVMLSRSDWEGTQPTRPEDKALSEERLAEASNFDPENDELLGDHEGSAVYTDELAAENEDNGLTLSDLRGMDYYDENWDLLLDQLDYSSEELNTFLYNAAFLTGQISSIGKPESVDHDGPQGWGLTGMDGGPDTCAYCSEVVVASTWNEDLAYDYGAAIGQEALTIGYTGWYGPGVNLHRTAFNGRNFEYYSEDALLSGKMAAGCVSGAADQGVVSIMKHFAMNEYEGPSCSMTVWANEQTIREVYLKAFEIPVKEARMTISYIADENGTMATKTMRATMGLMGAANMIGTKWCSANYPLLTNVSRGEWGYQGMFSTDMFLQCSPNIDTKVFRAGNNQKMWYMPPTETMDLDNATNRQAVRNAVKNISYAYVNSNLMQGVAPGSSVEYGMSPWMIGLIIGDAAVVVFVLAMIAVIIRRGRDEKAHPEKYRDGCIVH